MGGRPPMSTVLHFRMNFQRLPALYLFHEPRMTTGAGKTKASLKMKLIRSD